MHKHYIIDSVFNYINFVGLFQHGVGVEFVRFLPETHPPVLSNIFCELGVCENIVSIITHIYTLVYFINVSITMGDLVQSEGCSKCSNDGVCCKIILHSFVWYDNRDLYNKSHASSVK